MAAATGMGYLLEELADAVEHAVKKHPPTRAR
jgi:hypothetical protein